MTQKPAFAVDEQPRATPGAPRQPSTGRPPLVPRWSAAEYHDLLGKLRGNGKPFLDFAEYCAGKTGIWLRHDVELNVASARRMAQAEASQGIPASYFLCWESPALLATSEDHRREFVHELLALGHSVGVHSWVNVIERAPEWCSIDAVTFHRPRQQLDFFLRYDVGRAVYQPIVSGAAAYASDSAGRWRGRPPDEKWTGLQPLQLLIHPFWWSKGVGPISLQVTPAIEQFLPQASAGQ